MFRWQRLAGVLIGLGTASLFLALVGSSQRSLPPGGPILSECNGHLRQVVMHYEPGAREIVAPVYRDFLRALAPDTQVCVVCPDRAAYDEFLAVTHSSHRGLTPIIAGHPVTAWARDRWVALAPAPKGGATTLWSPRGEAGAEVWPARAGDERVGKDIATALGKTVRAVRSGLYFDGGDFLADSETAFVMPRMVPRNLQQTVATREELLSILARELKRRVILLNAAPDHHAGMFMASVGGRRMLVGDPSLAKQAIGEDRMDLPGGPDFSAATQGLFDAVAAQCAAAGYEVVRVPVVPACDGRTYLTYVNVIMDEVAGQRIVYLPLYRGVEPLNQAARKVWERLGYQVRAVDCTSTYRHFGCLHCLVNVVSRG